MENITEEPICIIEVNENLRRVQLGMELTRSLRQLNTNCEFKKKYREWCNIHEGLSKEVKAKQREYNREYYRTHPEHKAKMREYYRRIKHEKIIKI